METVDQVAASARQELQQNNPVPPITSVPRPVDDTTLWEAKRKREASTTTADYVTAAVHQDDFLNGMIANFVGEQMAPDPSFNIYDPATYKKYTEDLPDSLKGELLNAHSNQHALYIKGLLADKMHEQQLLGDLGWKGNTLRMLGGFVEPGNLAVMAGTMGLGAVVGGGSTLARANKMLRLAGEMEDGAAKVAAVSKATEALRTAAAEASTAKSVAGAVAGAAGINAGVEKLRQMYNFEDDTSGVIHAGLMGVILGTPLSLMGARSMARLKETAGNELAVLNAVQAHNAMPDVALHPADAATSAKVMEQHKFIADVLTGEKDLATAKEPALHADTDTFHAEPPAADPFGPPADGMMRLYRGSKEPQRPVTEPPPGSPMSAYTDAGRWFTKNRSTAEMYAKMGGGDGHLYYVDVPHTVFEENRPTEGHWLGETAALLPHEYVNKAKPHPDVPYAEGELLPEGMGLHSVGAAAASGSPTVGVAPVFMRNGRIDISATLNRNPNKVFQELAFKLVKDAIGNSKTDAQHWAASERKRYLQRTLGGVFHSEARDAYNEAVETLAVPMTKRKAFRDEFYNAVTAVTRGDPDVLNTYASIAPQLQRAAKANQEIRARVLELAKKAGVKGALNVDPKDTYVNRVWHFSNLRKAKQEHGAAQVHQLVADSIPVTQHTLDEAARLGITVDEVKLRTSKKFLSAVEKLEFSHIPQDVLLHAHDYVSLRAELQNANLTPGEIDSIVNTMFERSGAEADAGAAPNLKFRFDIDENQAARMPNGKTLKVSDLFENDSRILMDRYLNSMSGHTALAEQGIFSRAEFSQWMKDAEDEHIAQGHEPTKYNRDRQLLLDMYDHITGRPMSTQQFGTTDRMANSLRAFTRSAVLGQLGIAAAFELHKGIVLAGVTSALKQMPTLAAAVRSVRKGAKFSDDLGRDINTMWGFGTESASAYAREHEIADHPYDGWMSRVENVSNEASHVIDRLSGNSFFTSATRELSTRFAIQKYADFATGRRSMNATLKERAVGSGVDASALPSMLADLKAYTDHNGDRVSGIRWEDWQQQKPISYDNFTRVIERETRDAIQEHDIGETLPFMHSTLGKMFGELRTFMFVGHAKTSLKALHYRDATSASQLMLGIVSEMMAYSLQTSVNFAGNQKELERRMDPAYMAKSIFQRMALLGALPMFANSALKAAGMPMDGSTVNTDNRTLWMTPSMNTVSNAISAVDVLGQKLNPFSNTVTTDKEMRGVFGALPGGNLWGVRNVADWFAQGLPKHDPRQ
jgi:hypothetical protein